MILKIFTQPNCPKCPAAKEMVKKIKQEVKDLKIEYFDVSSVDGLAEASFYTVLSTPGIIICNEEGKEVKGWRGGTPAKKEIKTVLSKS